MGSLISKLLDDVSENSKDDVVHTATDTPVADDPRSPATAGVVRTPLPSSVADNNQAAWDPRSPTSGLVRTPLQPPLFETPPVSPDVSHAAQTGQQLADPRSPNCHVERTPMLPGECEVHRTWNSEDSMEFNEGDSMYPNPPSVPPCELTADNSRSDYGSLENLLMYNSGSEGSVCDSACISAANVGEIEIIAVDTVGEPAVDLAGDTNEDELSEEPDISPISSPCSKRHLLTSTSSESSNQQLPVAIPPKRSSVLSSTPNKPSRSGKAGLSARDTNSPLSIVQRKQVSKVNNCLTTSRAVGSPITVAQDKENLV